MFELLLAHYLKQNRSSTLLEQQGAAQTLGNTKFQEN